MPRNKSVSLAVGSVALLMVSTVRDASADPGFYFDLGALAMTRLRTATPVFSKATSNPNSGDVFNERNVNWAWVGGVEGRVGYRFAGPFGVEAGGFWLQPWHETVSNSNVTDNGRVPTTVPTLFGVARGDTLEMTYRSRIFGADVAATYALDDRVPGVTVLAGVTGFSLREALDLTGLFPPTNFETDTWRSNNLLVGPELGVRADLLQLCGRPPTSWSVMGSLRAAALWNNVDDHFNVGDSFGTFVPHRVTSSSSGTNFAGAVQAGINVGYHFSPSVKATLGYQALWLNGVALAADQIQATSNYNRSGPITMGRKTGDVLFHGLVLALKVALN